MELANLINSKLTILVIYASMKIDLEIKKILESGKFIGNSYFLPNIILDRKSYVKCNDVLESIGLKWNRKEKAHIGSGNDVEDTFYSILETGYTETSKDIRDKFQFFPTPKNLAEYVVELAEIKSDHSILEPSAGDGAILKCIPSEANNVTAIELDTSKIDILKEYASKVENTDFLDWKNETYDRIVLNPPYTKKQDLSHIKHAISLLKDGGIMVGIMSRGILFRNEYKELKDDILKHGYIEEVPEGTFKESGTMIGTCIVVYNK